MHPHLPQVRHKAGFSLVEALLVVALMPAISFALWSLLRLCYETSTNAGAFEAQKQLELDTVTEELYRDFSDGEAAYCWHGFLRNGGSLLECNTVEPLLSRAQVIDSPDTFLSELQKVSNRVQLEKGSTSQVRHCALVLSNTCHVLAYYELQAEECPKGMRYELVRFKPSGNTLMVHNRCMFQIRGTFNLAGPDQVIPQFRWDAENRSVCVLLPTAFSKGCLYTNQASRYAGGYVPLELEFKAQSL